MVRLAQDAAVSVLSSLNRRHWRDPERQRSAAGALGLAGDEMARAVAYAEDRHRFGQVERWAVTGALLGFLVAGGFGRVDSLAGAVAAWLQLGPIGAGLSFFGLVGLLGGLVSLPFDAYEALVIEERHGFNRQTLRGFLTDRVKAAAVAVVLGGPLIGVLLYVMQVAGGTWWLWAWGTVSGFGLLTAWIYPTLLAPLFNTFTPLPEGELKDRILSLAARVGFRTGGILVMDASRRTAHGNAYFTGLMGARRIVLFDTLVESLRAPEVVAVLAHELGHFKLHHVHWALLRGTLQTGLLFLVMGLLPPVAAFYAAFGLPGPSAHGTLLVFGLWFGPVSLLLRPLESALSRRHEFAADAFAAGHMDGSLLAGALLKLRERSRSLPLVHPLYSRVFYSHPPLLERLRALRSVPGPVW